MLSSTWAGVYFTRQAFKRVYFGTDLGRLDCIVHSPDSVLHGLISLVYYFLLNLVWGGHGTS